VKPHFVRQKKMVLASDEQLEFWSQQQPAQLAPPAPLGPAPPIAKHGFQSSISGHEQRRYAC